MQLHFNWIAIFVTATFGMIIPAIWYAPKVFGTLWMAESRLTDEDLKGSGSNYAIAAVCAVVLAFAMAGWLNFTGSASFLQGTLAGLQFWVGFVLTNFVVDYRFAKRSWKLLAINSGHQALTMALTGGVLASWK